MRAIEITDLSKTYRTGRSGQVTAVHHLNLAIDLGEVMGFLGPNGAGKSTTIEILMGLQNQTSGFATIFGIPAGKTAARTRVGYLPENPSFYDFLTAAEYLQFVGQTCRMGSSDIDRQSKYVLQLLDLADSKDRPIGSFSKGMTQRLGLAQALLHDPDLYILDEPMSGLDPLGRALVKEIIAGLRSRGKTVFFSTHITADVEAVCDRIAVISAGGLKAMERVDELLYRGIEGYTVRLRGNPGKAITDEFRPQRRQQDSYEVFVPKESLQDFMRKIVAHDAAIEFIEPKRKNIESFVLEVVA